LRILAASLVVLHHSLSLDYRMPLEDPLFAPSQGYTSTGFLAVCLFFCLSGFLVTPGLAKTGDVPGYLSRRFMRIMPLLIVVVALTVLVVGPLATSLPLAEYFSRPATWLYLKNATTSLSLTLPGVTNQHGTETVNGALWTLRYEWLCYFVLAVLSLLGVLRHRMVVLALWLAAVIVAAVGYGGQLDPGGAVVMLAHLFAYFGAGTLLYLFRQQVPVSPLLGLAALMALVMAWATGLGVILAPLLTAYLVVLLGLVRWPWGSWLAKADLSYGIYLIHGPAIALVMAWLAPTSALVLFLATMALVLPLALLSWTLLEKPALAHKTLPADLARRVLAHFGKGRIA